MAANFTCKYCGKELAGPTEFKAMQKLRAHLRRCEVKNGYSIAVKNMKFSFTPKGFADMQNVEAMKISVESLPDGVKVFQGMLLAMVKYKRIKNLRMETITTEVAQAAAG